MRSNLLDTLEELLSKGKIWHCHTCLQERNKFGLYVKLHREREDEQFYIYIYMITNLRGFHNSSFAHDVISSHWPPPWLILQISFAAKVYSEIVVSWNSLFHRQFK